MAQKKILFVLPSLRAGGAERVLSFLSNRIDLNNFNTILIVIGYDRDAVYDFPKNRTIFLNKKRTLSAIPALYKLIKKEKPHIVMSSIGQINTLMGLFSIRFSQVKFIARIASVNSIMSEFASKKSNWFLSVIANFAQKKHDKIICQSFDILNDLKNNQGVPEQKMVIINNPITSNPDKLRLPNNQKEVIKFITVGRLSPEKGQLRILECISKIKEYEFQYTIVGSGVLEESVKSFTKKMNLSNKVNFIGHTDKVNELLIQNDLFLQGSYVEGFPNAALESCVVGVPVLAFNVPGGTKEIIKHGQNGLLANTEEEFQNLLKNKNTLLNFDPIVVSNYTKEKFAADKILSQYESVFKELTQ